MIKREQGVERTKEVVKQVADEGLSVPPRGIEGKVCCCVVSLCSLVMIENHMVQTGC